MQLKRVDIRNYRSIAETSIDFQPRCRILVGINEAGKTNILQALSLLDTKSKVLPNDIREFRGDEDLNQDAFVSFVFTVDGEQQAKALESVLLKLLTLAPKVLLISYEGVDLSLDDFNKHRNEVLYCVDLKTNQRNITAWKLHNGMSLLPRWKKISAACPKDFSINLPNGKTALLTNYILVDTESIRGIPENYIEPGELKPIFDIYNTSMKQYAVEQLPTCIYWSYKDENLLPGQINIQSFAANPDSCLPLKCMFKLSKVEDIPTAIAKAKARADGMRNLLNRVSEQTTRYLHGVWKEYKDLSILLFQNGENIDAVVRDKHTDFNMTRRSDGFKRFVTFLLLISARVESNDLTNVLYLHDEPDTSLHPSGARHLRDELIKISKKNYVVYSTHSIFMIDNRNMDRHLIVKRIDEITTTNKPEHSDIMDEEVLYNAIGYSIFENLKPFNIIFEGWRDKQVFEIALSKLPPKYKQLNTIFAGVGRTHAKGVKDVSRITAMLELAQRNYLVISDSDKPARERQSVFKGEGEWKRYDELTKGIPIITVEDFINIEAFSEVIEQTRADNPTLPEFQNESLRDSRGKLATICAWMSVAKMDSDEIKRALDKIKEQIIENLKPNHIGEAYLSFLDVLSQIIQSIVKDA